MPPKKGKETENTKSLTARNEKSIHRVHEPSNRSGSQSARFHGSFGILQLDIDNVVRPPIFTEQLTLEAMDRSGVSSDELVKLTQDEISKIPGTAEVRQHIVNKLEERRRSAYELIKQTRKTLIEELDKKADFNRKYRVKERDTGKSAEVEYERLQKMQRREIEQMLTIELKREDARQADLKRQQKWEESMKHKEELKKQKQLEENEKKKLQEQKVFNRIRQRELIVEQQAAKQRQDEQRRMELELEREKKRKEDAERAEKAKEEKIKKLNEQREERDRKERVQREENEKQLKARDEARAEAKRKELEVLKEQHLLAMTRQQERISRAKLREQVELKERLAKMEEQDKQVQMRIELL